MDKIKSRYEKDKLPPALIPFAIEKDGFMVIEFDNDVALATNPALATKNAELLNEKKTVQVKYDALVTSSAEISREVLELRTKVASGGQVSADEMAILAAVKGIDGTPDEIKKKISEHPTLVARVASMESETQNRQIADVTGWNEVVFSDLRNNPEKSKDLTFALEDVTENGKTTKKAFITSKDANGVSTKTEASEFAKTNGSWMPYMPILEKAQPQSGPNWIPQRKAGGEPELSKSAVDAHIEARNAAAKARPNPLLPPPVAQAAQALGT